MSRTASLLKPPEARGDFLPASPGGFAFCVVGLSFGLRAAGYLLARDPAAITHSHDWIYHAFWLPLHLFLARYAAVVFARNVQGCIAFAGSQWQPRLQARVDAITSRRAWLGSVLLVAPFMVLDGIAGVQFVHDNAAAQGHASVLIPVIWMIEWLATAQIWLFVLGSIHFNSLVLAEAHLVGRHEEILLSGACRGPLLCGLQNALITGLYGLSTVGYVWYADGQLSDYLVLGISTLFVLICFFAALAQLKVALRRSLDDAFDAFRDAVAASAVTAPGPESAMPTEPRLPYTDLKEAIGLVFERRLGQDRKLEERLRGIKLALMVAVPPSAGTLQATLYARALMLIECETRFAQFGVGEIKSLSLRAVMPLLLIVGKSAGGLIGH